jgi:hypothetical protein
VGEHVLEADLRLAGAGTWREFFVVGVDAEAASAWEATAERSRIEMPKGSRELTERTPHRMPE